MPGTRWKLEARAEAQRHRGTATGCSGGVEADIASRGWWRRHFAYEDRARERGLAGSCRAGRQAGKLAAARFAAELGWREVSASTRRMGRCWGWDRLGLEPLGVMFRQIAARYDSR